MFDSLYEKVWQIAVALFVATLGLCRYWKQKSDDREDKQDMAIRSLEIKQAGYDKSIEYLIAKFAAVEDSVKKFNSRKR